MPMNRHEDVRGNGSSFHQSQGTVATRILGTGTALEGSLRNLSDSTLAAQVEVRVEIWGGGAVE